MDDSRKFAGGEQIFIQGEVGAALFVIKEGRVEIYKNTPKGEVTLTFQGPGEVVGMLTFFSGGKRLASARAATDVEGQWVEKKVGADPLHHLPKWVQLVLKEFSLRLEQINQQYSQTLQDHEELKVIDHLFISTQVADSMAELGRFKLNKLPDGREFVLRDDMMSLLEACLGFARKDLDRVMEAFIFAGQVKLEIEPDHNKEIFTLSSILRLKQYAEFVRSTRSGKAKRLLHTDIPFRYRRVLFGLREFVIKSGGDVNKSFKISIEELAVSFKAQTNLELDQAAIDLGAKAGLVQLSLSGTKKLIEYNPVLLGRTLIALNVVRRLKMQPGTEEELE